MTESINFDNLFNSIGIWGKWQWIHLIGAIACWMHAALSTLLIVVIAKVPDHVCNIPNATDLVNEGMCHILNTTSNETIGCIYGYIYNVTNVKSSIVSEWDLVCHRDYLPHMSQLLFMAGQTIGCYIFTYIADTHGRKRTYLFGHFFLIFLEIAGSFVPSIYWFLALRFFCGLAQMGTATILYVLLMEMFPLKQNPIVGVYFCNIWSLGICTEALLGYLMRDISWRYLHLTVGCMFLLILPQIWFYDESMRWLFANNRSKEGQRILRKAAKINNVPMNEVEKHIPINETLLKNIKMNIDAEENGVMLMGDNSKMKHSSSSNNDIRKEKLNFLHILKHPKLLRHLLISWIMWPTQSLIYYGLTLMANELAGNSYLNLFFYGIVDIPSKILVAILMKRIGRRIVYIMYMFPCAISLLIAAVMSASSINYPVLATVFSIIAKFFVGSTFTFVWIYFLELYPTNLRSTGLGSASASARLAGMIAPFAGYLAKYVAWGPGAIFSIIGMISCALILLLPETRNKPLIQSMDDVNDLYNYKPPKSEQK